MRFIGKSGFRILQTNTKSENGFHLREIRPQGGCQFRNPNPDFMDFLFTVRWEIQKGICKTVLVNSGVLKDSFSNPFRIFQAKGTNENPTIDITA